MVVMEKERSRRSDDRGADSGDYNLATGWRAGGGWVEEDHTKWQLTAQRRVVLSWTAETWLADSVRGRIGLVKRRGSTYRHNFWSLFEFSSKIIDIGTELITSSTGRCNHTSAFCHGDNGLIKSSGILSSFIQSVPPDSKVINNINHSNEVIEHKCISIQKQTQTQARASKSLFNRNKF